MLRCEFGIFVRAVRAKRPLNSYTDVAAPPIDVKNVQIKNLKNVKKRKNVTKINVLNTLPILSVVQLHAWCPRNGLQGNSEYAIPFSFTETVVVLG